MSEMKQGGDDGAAPRCPPHPGFVRGLCIQCGVKEEDAEGGALELTIEDEIETKMMEVDEAAAARCPPHPGFVSGFCSLCGAKEEDAEGGAPELTIEEEIEMKMMEVDESAAARCPPHPGFVSGLCSSCGAKEEDAEGGAPELTIEEEIEMKMMEVDESAAGRCPPHPGFVSGLCSSCGAKEDDDAGGSASAGVAAGYIVHGAQTLQAAATTSIPVPLPLDPMGTLLRERKLTLILDLDHTLLNSTDLNDLSQVEVQNGFTPTTEDDVDTGLFRLDGHGISKFVKLRPFARGFLEQASAMFEMHVYTLADQAYARATVSLLDPYGVYFGQRIVSKAESTHPSVKSLDVIPGAEAVAVVILDDSDHGWPGHQDNLILIDGYHYFASACRNLGYNISSMAEQNRDEREHDGSLAVALRVLRRVHQLFFGLVSGDNFPDVRDVIGVVRRDVLRGCTVAFSRLDDMEDFNVDDPLWILAEQLGAVCMFDVDEMVTHVVAEGPGTEKAQWARDNNKFLVNSGWIKAASFRWCRPNEQDFPVLHGV